jgi:uncharacterized protein (DUF983 family)
MEAGQGGHTGPMPSATERPADLRSRDWANTKISPLAMLWRGMRKKCPQCGGGHLFSGWINMKPHCPACGYQFERSADDAFFLGAVAINFVITELLLAVVMVVGFVATWPDPPVTKLIVIACAETIVAGIFFYPFSKTIWAAIDLAMHRSKI